MTSSDKSYLVYMAARLLEMRRVLKTTGSIYLHCDPTMSHYLKLVLDAIFGKANFRNDVIWKRRHGSASHVHKSNRLGVCNDTCCFTQPRTRHDSTHNLHSKNRNTSNTSTDFSGHVMPDGRRYRIDNLANPAPRPNLMYDYKGFPHPKNGWAISREKMEEWDLAGRLEFPKKPTGRIQRRRFLDELKGKPVQTMWVDIRGISGQSKERTGYPTQKPLALLDRIIKASSNEGNIVLDPFAGCATACVSAESLHRQWVGIDISPKAAELVRQRMRDELGMFYQGAHRTDVPRRTDIGKLPKYNALANRTKLYGQQAATAPDARHTSRRATSTSTTSSQRLKAGPITLRICNCCAVRATPSKEIAVWST